MKAAFAAAALFLAAACSEASGIAHDARVRTDASVYTLPGSPGPATTVKFTVRNTGSFSIAIANCGQGVAAELQRRDANGAWVTAALMECPSLAIYAPIVLDPGEVAEGEMKVSESGLYRLRVQVAEEEGAEFSATAVSPDFVVRWLED
jgi:hypothetical protein